ncbi:malate:quinone oxidoreductase [Oleiphilus sp. HI0081]|jgi:malate dehydrogenase (quinone)|nr:MULTISPECIES: malate:quinone oxidoreductase [unclassified Oleiphilus]KZY76681.1 malate:quinone oxidoreductase [Oleiphilus sp. HI0068]KZY87722.1 malate:quinone oxidoreductase [Oleiphilus sp. HI0069]KZZ19740.1 malate:quinone oxidoreductase [Oleiphilus sp. HI0078]KZZ21212.1 malate:quinone oxidoreductase [Oleiphilus sp. HI0081]KZZ33539.1 malate:quinone oxidoreductase [Oleiphilus sp. HI0085]
MNVVIVGAGIMGITFATLAKELNPKLKITIIERLSGPAKSNSSVFNNAGTGHEANCELNYTPVDEDIIEVEKALAIHGQFNIAKQFWAYLVKKGIIEDPTSFIVPTKHCTLVHEDSINELKLRFEEMSQHHYFEHMQYSEDHDEIKSWIPYTMENRPTSEKMAATMIATGTDVNFESITEQMAAYLAKQEGVEFHYGTHVTRVHKNPVKQWLVETQKGDQKMRFKGDTLFVAAGGGAFPLLKLSHLPDRTRFAGFPVGGRFLMAPISEEDAKHYSAKTYGKAKVGAPPMSVPHLDLRAANGKHYLLFGPFATFMPVLEKGRGFLEYLKSMRFHDIPNFLNVAREHFPLMKYLISETFVCKEKMLKELEDFAPGLSSKFNWQVSPAGQRVQIIKDGDLQMGTEIIVSDDKTYGTLLGASPGASVSPEVMLRLVEQLMPFLIEDEEGNSKLREIFPVHSLRKLEKDAKLYRAIRDDVNETLGIG